jgi:hypothetical protein
LLVACGGGGGGESAARAPVTAPPAENSAPAVSGNPPSSALNGRVYSFRPEAIDPDGDALTFSIANRPAWASFDETTGRLRGTPSPAELGVSSDITITVTDGATSVALPAFSITVVAVATGVATLGWIPPTNNTDGTALTDLAGFNVYWGTEEGDFPNSASIENPGLAAYVIDQLTPATWYFTVTAVTATGVESSFSNVAAKTVM